MEMTLWLSSIQLTSHGGDANDDDDADDGDDDADDDDGDVDDDADAAAADAAAALWSCRDVHTQIINKQENLR